MEQVRTQLPPSAGAVSKAAASVKDRVDSALSRLESLVDERLRGGSRAVPANSGPASALGSSEQHDELKKVRDGGRGAPRACDGVYPLAAGGGSE